MAEIFNKNKALAIVRQEIGLTKVQFAKELMVTKEHISALEAGTRVPSDMMLELMACKFFVRKEWLKSGEGKIFRELQGTCGSGCVGAIRARIISEYCCQRRSHHDSEENLRRIRCEKFERIGQEIGH